MIVFPPSRSRPPALDASCPLPLAVLSDPSFAPMKKLLLLAALWLTSFAGNAQIPGSPVSAPLQSAVQKVANIAALRALPVPTEDFRQVEVAGLLPAGRRRRRHLLLGPRPRLFRRRRRGAGGRRLRLFRRAKSRGRRRDADHRRPGGFHGGHHPHRRRRRRARPDRRHHPMGAFPGCQLRRAALRAPGDGVLCFRRSRQRGLRGHLRADARRIGRRRHGHQSERPPRRRPLGQRGRAEPSPPA